MSEGSTEVVVGQRRSLKGHRLTIRYSGPVDTKPGDWLGVEWDDSQRGKHDGSHQGRRYFRCASSSPTAASFIRPTQPWDQTKSFMQALTEKYTDNPLARDTEDVYVSGKQAEEIGFDKLAKRMAELRGIHVLGLDQMSIVHESCNAAENEKITKTCASITDLNIGGNLFDHFAQISHLVSLLQILRSLTLDGNRFRVDEQIPSNTTLTSLYDLSVSNTLLQWSTLTRLACTTFPCLQSLQASRNEWNVIESLSLPPTLHTIGLDFNHFTKLEDVQVFNHTPLRRVSLKSNEISQVGSIPPNQIEDLDLGFNQINDMTFFDHLASAFPSLKNLRVSGNPVYNSLTNAERKPLTSEDGYMLTIARLPQLQTLNYSQITDKERLNAELYYLAQIAAELTLSPANQKDEILAKHARWGALCEEYGEPTLANKTNEEQEFPPNTLAAHLITMDFYISEQATATGLQPQTWSRDLPKSCTIYTILGLVGKRLGIMPLKLRLIWETGERDPVRSSQFGSAPEWWDSDESDDEDGTAGGSNAWILREVELQAGTRPLSTFVDGRRATIRVEMRDSKIS